MWDGISSETITRPHVAGHITAHCHKKCMYVSEGPVDKKSALVQVIAWCQIILWHEDYCSWYHDIHLKGTQCCDIMSDWLFDEHLSISKWKLDSVHDKKLLICHYLILRINVVYHILFQHHKGFMILVWQPTHGVSVYSLESALVATLLPPTAQACDVKSSRSYIIF